MPDISALNGTPIDSVAEFDGLAKASILDIDGVAVPLAIGTPVAAYSVRLLGSSVGVSSYTGPCMRVRRASDNVEADVGFDTSLTDPAISLASPISNTSDAQSYTDFADFVDHTGTPTDALVRWWYDQSGNTRDAGQSTAPNQPQIYDATTGLITENSKPMIQPQDSTDGFQGVSFPTINYGDPISLYSVSRSETGLSVMGYFDNTLNQLIYLSQSGNTGLSSPTTWELSNAVMYWNGVSKTMPQSRGNTHTQFFQNQTLASINYLGVANPTGTYGPIDTLNISNNQNYWRMHSMQEFILYSSDETNNRTDIENNINGFFSVYP